jgi:putative membrane protein
MIKKLGMITAAVFLGLFITVGFPSLAQMNPTTPNPSQNQPNQNQISESQINEVDRQFMLEANQNAIAAIALGELALEQASTNEVRQFAQAEINEQVQVRNQLTRLAPTLGSNLPTAPTPRDQEVQARMTRLTGTEFDRAFMNEVGINAHLENAAIYQREVGLGQNRDLIALATQSLPIITQHYNIASALTGYEVAQVPTRVDSGTSAPSAAPQ